MLEPRFELRGVLGRCCTPIKTQTADFTSTYTRTGDHCFFSCKVTLRELQSSNCSNCLRIGITVEWMADSNDRNDSSDAEDDKLKGSWLCLTSLWTLSSALKSESCYLGSVLWCRRTDSQWCSMKRVLHWLVNNLKKLLPQRVKLQIIQPLGLHCKQMGRAKRTRLLR